MHDLQFNFLNVIYSVVSCVFIHVFTIEIICSWPFHLNHSVLCFPGN